MIDSFDARAFQKFEAAGWDTKAHGYHAFYPSLTGPVVIDLLDAAAVGAGTRVLDIGSGPGYVAAACRSRGAVAVGVDQSLVMARLAGKLSPATNYLVADGQRLPVADGAVAAVVGNFVLHHFPDPRRAVAEFARVTAAGGRLGLTVWDAPQRCRFLGVFNDSVRRAAVAVPATVPVGPPMAAGDADYADLLVQAGYAPDPVRTRGWLHDFGDSTRLWDGLLAASVRTAALVTEQDRPTQQRIRAAFEAVVEEYRTPGGLHVPISVKIISGTRLG